MEIGRLQRAIRLASEADASEIAQLFHRTVCAINSRDYSPAQIRAWAGTQPEPEKWRQRQATRATLVCSLDDVILGFGELGPAGHIDALYVSANCQGHGVGSALLFEIERMAIASGTRLFHTDASVTARPFFDRRGYRVVTEQQVAYNGQIFRNYRMEKPAEPMTATRPPTSDRRTR